jgi:hypothetical protein
MRIAAHQRLVSFLASSIPGTKSITTQVECISMEELPDLELHDGLIFQRHRLS